MTDEKKLEEDVSVFVAAAKTENFPSLKGGYELNIVKLKDDVLSISAQWSPNGIWYTIEELELFCRDVERIKEAIQLLRNIKLSTRDEMADFLIKELRL